MKSEEYKAAELLWRLVLGGGIPYLFYLLFNKIFEIIIDEYSIERKKVVVKKLNFLENYFYASQKIKELLKIFIYIILALATSKIYPLLILFAFMKLIRELSILFFPEIKKWYLDGVIFTCTLTLMFILFGNEKITSNFLEIIKIFKKN